MSYKSHYRVASITAESSPIEGVRRRSSSAAFRHYNMPGIRLNEVENQSDSDDNIPMQKWTDFTDKTTMSKWSLAEIFSADDTLESRRRRRTRLTMLGGILFATICAFAFIFPRHAPSLQSLPSLPSLSSLPKVPTWSSHSYPEVDTERLCSFDSAFLRQNLSLGESYDFARRIIVSKQSQRVKLQSSSTMNNIGEALLPPTQRMNAGDEMVQLSNCAPPLELEAPYTQKVDGRGMFFGMSTNTHRLRDALPRIKYWLGDTGAKLLVIAPAEEAEEDMRDTEKLMKENGMDVTIERGHLNWVQGYFTLIKRMYELRTPRTQWMVTMDDDTFIPSFPRLVERLNSRYDASQPTWVGTLSEDFTQVQYIGWMSFGGAGIFVSTPLAAIVAEHTDECLAKAREFDGGDYILSTCIMEHSSAKLNLDNDLYQLDVRGYPGGLLESGFAPSTLHHLYSWVWAPAEPQIPVASVCGQECLWYRWFFSDRMMLSNGFSIVRLREDIDPGIWQIGMEKTFNLESDGEAFRESRVFAHKMSYLRPALKVDEEKETWRLEASYVQDDGSVQQLYVRRGNDQRADQVFELIWLKTE